MRTSLANQLLRTLVGLNEDEESELVPRLMTMAELKWDSYEGFGAGQRFMESLARWLPGFSDQPARRRWLDFLLDKLVFVSAAEVDHLIAVTYPDFIRPAVLERAALASQIDPHRKARLMDSPAFKVELRRILVLALSDGARLDVLRRNSDLSHEQFVPLPDVSETRRGDLLKKLGQALAAHGGDAELSTFNHVLLVDDFYGSGTSLIDAVSDGAETKLVGKIARFIEHADSLTVADGERPALLAEDYGATILLYMASSRAKQHIEETLANAGLADRWRLDVVQVLDDNCSVRDEVLLADCDIFWDPVLEDEHKSRAARGYKDCALAVVLHHNAPNNSVSPLWADSIGRRRQGFKSLERRALFPRYERHHSDRP